MREIKYKVKVKSSKKPRLVSYKMPTRFYMMSLISKELGYGEEELGELNDGDLMDIIKDFGLKIEVKK